MFQNVYEIYWLWNIEFNTMLVSMFNVSTTDLSCHSQGHAVQGLIGLVYTDIQFGLKTNFGTFIFMT